MAQNFYGLEVFPSNSVRALNGQLSGQIIIIIVIIVTGNGGFTAQVGQLGLNVCHHCRWHPTSTFV